MNETDLKEGTQQNIKPLGTHQGNGSWPPISGE